MHQECRTVQPVSVFLTDMNSSDGGFWENFCKSLTDVMLKMTSLTATSDFLVSTLIFHQPLVSTREQPLEPF